MTLPEEAGGEKEDQETDKEKRREQRPFRMRVQKNRRVCEQAVDKLLFTYVSYRPLKGMEVREYGRNRREERLWISSQDSRGPAQSSLFLTDHDRQSSTHNMQSLLGLELPSFECPPSRYFLLGDLGESRD